MKCLSVLHLSERNSYPDYKKNTNNLFFKWAKDWKRNFIKEVIQKGSENMLNIIIHQRNAC